MGIVIMVFFHGENYPKTIFSIVALKKGGYALNLVRGHNFTDEDMNVLCPWFNKSSNFEFISAHYYWAYPYYCRLQLLVLSGPSSIG